MNTNEEVFLESSGNLANEDEECISSFSNAVSLNSSSSNTTCIPSVETSEGKSNFSSLSLPSSVGQVVGQIPEMKVKAGPRDGAKWNERLKEEFEALIFYVQRNKALDNDWFNIEPINKSRTKWEGKCWYYYESLKYEFVLKFEIPMAYPSANPELCLPELDGTTSKMYRGGKICLDIHFQPLWRQKNGRFSIAHALALGLAPWLSAEVPLLVARGVIKPIN